MQAYFFYRVPYNDIFKHTLCATFGQLIENTEYRIEWHNGGLLNYPSLVTLKEIHFFK
jgi:hypothetical protein